MKSFCVPPTVKCRKGIILTLMSPFLKSRVAFASSNMHWMMEPGSWCFSTFSEQSIMKWGMFNTSEKGSILVHEHHYRDPVIVVIGIGFPEGTGAVNTVHRRGKNGFLFGDHTVHQLVHILALLRCAQYQDRLIEFGNTFAHL